VRTKRMQTRSTVLKWSEQRKPAEIGETVSELSKLSKSVCADGAAGAFDPLEVFELCFVRDPQQSSGFVISRLVEHLRVRDFRL